MEEKYYVFLEVPVPADFFTHFWVQVTVSLQRPSPNGKIIRSGAALRKCEGRGRWPKTTALFSKGCLPGSINMSLPG
jgi:hypothetical protein